MKGDFYIRHEIPSRDLPEIREVLTRAFAETGSGDSHEPVRGRDDVVSLVAEHAGRVVGNVLFTPVVLEDAAGDIPGAGLLLLAVDPDYQRMGIGRELTQRGLAIIRERELPFVIVIGRAEYYPRFGFRPGTELGFRCQWDGIGDQSFMALILDPMAMRGKSGLARYCDRF